MEGGKKQDAGAPANSSSSSSTSSSSPSGFFSSVFPPPSTVMAKDSSQSDLYWTLSKQRADGSIGNAQGAATDLIDICKLRWMWFRLTMVFEMANHREVQPKGKQHGARMVNQLIPVNLKNQPISAHLCTMGVVISMSLLHPTKSLELQKFIKLMKGMVRVTQTLPTEVNGGKVVGRATAIPVIGSLWFLPTGVLLSIRGSLVLICFLVSRLADYKYTSVFIEVYSICGVSGLSPPAFIVVRL